MDIFGQSWREHDRKLRESFDLLNEEDLCVICGDISWGMGLEDCLQDFLFIDSLPGKKIILKGNHDYWWTTVKKINEFFAENGIDSIEILNNNSFRYNGISICGTRGWFFEEETGTAHDKKILARETGRLKASLESAGEGEKLVFLHYPPIYRNYRCGEILELLKEYGIKHCYYGHIHGRGIPSAVNGWVEGCEYRLVSADALGFKPYKIC